MNKQKRTVFYLSDRTGITAETLGHSLLSQFEDIQTVQVRMPFIDSVAKAGRGRIASIVGAQSRAFSRLAASSSVFQAHRRDQLRAGARRWC